MRLSLFAVAALCVSPLAAHADTFDFSYTGSGTTASGVLTTSAPTNGMYTITGISGMRNGLNITGLDLTFGSPDELLYYPATDTGTALIPTYLDNDGFSYDVGSAKYNIFTSGTRPTVVENDGGPSIQFSITPGNTAVTPEPSSLALLGTGVLGLVGMMRKRFAR